MSILYHGESHCLKMSHILLIVAFHYHLYIHLGIYLPKLTYLHAQLYSGYKYLLAILIKNLGTYILHF